jgi:Ni/Fe-hydrogenase 1 B-type cytochrome subunit
MSSNQAGNPALGRRVYAGRKVVREGTIDVDAASGEVLGGRLQPVYVYEAPVRIWHWVMMLAMIVLAATGYLIGSPWSGPRGEAVYSYFFGYVRMIHFIAAWVFAIAFVVRLYWAIAGNHHARSIFVPPMWSGSWWSGLFRQTGYYLFMR